MSKYLAQLRARARKLRRNYVKVDVVELWARCWSLYVVLDRMEVLAAGISSGVSPVPPPFPDDLPETATLRRDGDGVDKLQQVIAQRQAAMKGGHWVNVAAMFQPWRPPPKPKLKIIPGHPRWAQPPPRPPRPPGVPDRVWVNDVKECASLVTLVGMPA
jgi:hypothetical protein